MLQIQDTTADLAVCKVRLLFAGEDAMVDSLRGDCTKVAESFSWGGTISMSKWR